MLQVAADRNSQARRRLYDAAPSPRLLRPRRQSSVELRLDKIYSEAVDGDGATPESALPPAPGAPATSDAVSCSELGVT